MILKRALSFGCIFVLGAASAFAQSNDRVAQGVATGSTIVVDANLVSVVFSVTDRRGRYRTGLGPDDFTVFEGDTQQTVRDFLSESNLPLRIGLLIDTSQSIRARFQFEQEAAIDFLHTVLRPKTDRAFVVSFDSEARIEQDLTGDPIDLAEAIRELRAGGGTALYDAIYTSSRLMMAESTNERGEPFRKMLIIISDGQDSYSQVTREEALEMARRHDVTIFTVSTTAPDIRYSEKAMELRNPCKVHNREGDRVLQRYAQATGGASYCPFNTIDVGRSFQRIADELRSQYTLTYRPTNRSNEREFREIDITTRRDGLSVHHRPGYYAKPTERDTRRDGKDKDDKDDSGTPDGK